MHQAFERRDLPPVRLPLVAGVLGGKFWASPLYASGRLYLFDEDGVSHVLAAGRTAKKLATNTLNDGCRASPAVAGKALFVRTLTHLYRIEERD